MENDKIIFYKTPSTLLPNNMKFENNQTNKNYNVKICKSNSSRNLPKNSKMCNILSSIDINALPSLPSDRLNKNFVLSPLNTNSNTNFNTESPSSNSALLNKCNNLSRSYKNLNIKDNLNNGDIESGEKCINPSKMKKEIGKNLKHSNNYIIFKNFDHFYDFKTMGKNYNNFTNNIFHKKYNSWNIYDNICNTYFKNDNNNNNHNEYNTKPYNNYYDNNNYNENYNENYNANGTYNAFQNFVGSRYKKKELSNDNKIITVNNNTNKYRHYISKRFNFSYYRKLIKIQSFYRGYSFRKKAIKKINNLNLGFMILEQNMNTIFFIQKQIYFIQLISVLRRLNKKSKIQIIPINAKKFRNLSPCNAYSFTPKNKNLLLLSINSIINLTNKICYRYYFNTLLNKMILLSIRNRNIKKISSLKKIITKINNKILKKYFKKYKEQILIERIKEKIKAKVILNSTMPLGKNVKTRITNKKYVRIKHGKKKVFDSGTKSSIHSNNSNKKRINSPETSRIKLNIKKIVVSKPHRKFFTFIDNDRNLKDIKLMNLVEKIDKKKILTRNFVFWKKCNKK